MAPFEEEGGTLALYALGYLDPIIADLMSPSFRFSYLGYTLSDVVAAKTSPQGNRKQ